MSRFFWEIGVLGPHIPSLAIGIERLCPGLVPLFPRYASGHRIRSRFRAAAFTYSRVAHRLSGCLALLVLCCCTQDTLPRADRVRLETVPLGSVPWRAWRDRPNADGKPILLYQYNRRSYWCHRLAAEVLNDPLIVREITRVTFPIAVDATMRPDLFEEYGLGGWPSLAVVDPNRGWITGTRYIEADDLEDLMRRLHTIYDVPGRLDDVERARSRLNARRKSAPAPLDSVTVLTLQAFTEHMTEQVHRTVPSEETVLLLWQSGRIDSSVVERVFDPGLENDEGLYVAGRITPDGVLRGEEVTLSRNAALLMAAAGIATETGEEVWQDRAQRLADSIEAALGITDDDGPYYAAGVAGFLTEGSEFSPSLYGDGTRPLDARWIPRWNAQAVSAMIFAQRAGVVVSRRWREVADRLAERYGPDGAPADGGELLADAALTARALLDVHDLDSSTDHLTVCERIVNRAWEIFLEPQAGVAGRIRVEDDQTALDRHEPGAIAVLAESLVRLGDLTGREEYLDRAERILAAWVPRSQGQAAGAGALGRALALFVGNRT